MLSRQALCVCCSVRTTGQGSQSPFVRRMAVAFVFPFFMVAVDHIGSVILFKRGGRVDKDVRCLLSHLLAAACAAAPLPANWLCLALRSRTLPVL